MPKLLPDVEKALLIKLKAGDQKAFNTLYQVYERKVYYNLRKLIHIPEIVGELHQDVFLKIWNKRIELNEELPFEGFLITISRNCAIDFYRKAARDKKLTDQLALMMTELHDPITDSIALKETSRALEAAIDKLPPQRALVFRKIKLDDQSYEHAAWHFGVSKGTIKDHMAKAMNFLRREISNSRIFFFIALIIFSLIQVFRS
ncbi:RNA polymerase sigma factor [Pedobacter gandavensis]|uniref:RNA polymerase sigma factor n=1 Tax=Pedobacter gandavensis TaxID=2679963 RepID=UPI002930F43B|nr:sigma-70 family RNA polymerase sigma factor [Pedobacter gandavensis]